MHPRRGEIWWVRLDPVQGSEIAKTRPCIVVTTNVANERRRTVVVVPFSTSPNAAPPIRLSLVCEGRRCVAVIDQIRAVTKERLLGKIEDLPPEDLRRVDDAIRRILEL